MFYSIETVKKRVYVTGEANEDSYEMIMFKNPITKRLGTRILVLILTIVLCNFLFLIVKPIILFSDDDFEIPYILVINHSLDVNGFTSQPKSTSKLYSLNSAEQIEVYNFLTKCTLYRCIHTPSFNKNFGLISKGNTEIFIETETCTIVFRETLNETMHVIANISGKELIYRVNKDTAQAFMSIYTLVEKFD